MGRVVAVVLGGGTGSRFGGALPKQFEKLAGRTVIEHTLERFDRSRLIDEIFVVVPSPYRALMEELLSTPSFGKVTKVLNGGQTRQESSYIGITACSHDTTKVILHDAVRPFVSDRIIRDVVRALDRHAAVDVAIPTDDTIIRIGEDQKIDTIPDRSRLRRGQTPQGFRMRVIKEAHQLALSRADLSVTDDCGLVVHFGLCPVYVVPGDRTNIKITHVEDLHAADRLFQTQSESSLALQMEDPDLADRMAGKVLAVFGDTGGIGCAIARLAQGHGASVHGFSKSKGTDVTKYPDVAKALDAVALEEGRIDGVVNATGLLAVCNLVAQSVARIHEIVNVNYSGTIHIVKAALPFLEASKGSLILFSSSSYTRGRAGYGAYSSSKAAIVNFAQAIAEEEYRRGVRINVVNPERTDTPMRVANFGLEPKESLLSPEVVARAALQTMVSGITGQVIDVRRQRDDR